MSAVDDRSRSLAAGEKCRGGGVSRESSFTTWGCDGRGGAVNVRGRDEMRGECRSCRDDRLLDMFLRDIVECDGVVVEWDLNVRWD